MNAVVRTLVLFLASLVSPAFADEQVVPTPATPVQPLYEATRPAPNLKTAEPLGKGSRLPTLEQNTPGEMPVAKPAQNVSPSGQPNAER